MKEKEKEKNEVSEKIAGHLNLLEINSAEEGQGGGG